MQRRNFLKYLSISAIVALVPSSLEAAINSDPTLYVFIQAGGGWDVTSLCDPKGYMSSDQDKNGNILATAMNRSYANKDIITLGNGISFPPISVATHGTSHGVTYDYETFFRKYENELLIINGIDAQTNAHSAGLRYMMSGRLSEGYPSLSALIAGAKMHASPLSFVTSGGYDFTDGFVAGTRISDSKVLLELSDNNKKDAKNTFMHTTVNSRLKKMREERILRLVSKERLASVKQQMEQFHLAHTGTSELVKLVQSLKDLDPNLDAASKTNTVFKQGRFALAGFKAGLTTSTNIYYGGFDTHGDNDRQQLSRLSKLLEGIDLLKQEAQNLGIDQNIVYVVGSEFGRTPGYNAKNGKDHWSVTSMMFMGKGINRKGVVGSTTSSHKIKKINLATLKEDANGAKLNYGHINKALRKLSGLENNSAINQQYPFSGNIDSVNLFG